MRTLCIHLPPPLGSKNPEQTGVTDVFLCFSPRVQYQAPHFVFVDIESTAGLLGGEDRLLAKALELAKTIGATEASAAIADHPPVAQVLALHCPSMISPMGEDRKSLAKLSLAVLEDLEGLGPWAQSRRIEHIAAFFQTLGLKEVGDLMHFELPSFRERWGEVGVLLWKRLHGLDPQVISPFIPGEPFKSYGYFDDPAQILSMLEARLHENLNFLFLRLAGLGRFAREIKLTLHCEYSDLRHQVHVEPVNPSRDLELFEDLIHKRLEKMDLLNPIREFEIELIDVPEKIMQMDFFEPRNQEKDRWQRLISFAKQADLEVGFLEPVARHFPEDSYHLKADWPKLLSLEDHIEHQDEAIQVKSVYAKGLGKAPRPSLLLTEPRPLQPREMRSMQKLSFFPTERIEAPWWERMKEALLREKSGKEKSTRENSVEKLRDYYFALSKEGELLWIYQDRVSKNYYLHGYFD